MQRDLLSASGVDGEKSETGERGSAEREREKRFRALGVAAPRSESFFFVDELSLYFSQLFLISNTFSLSCALSLPTSPNLSPDARKSLKRPKAGRQKERKTLILFVVFPSVCALFFLNSFFALFLFLRVPLLLLLQGHHFQGVAPVVRTPVAAPVGAP